MKTTIEFENNFIVFYIENIFVNVCSKFIQYQRMNFDFNNKHKNNNFEIILYNKCKINDEIMNLILRLSNSLTNFDRNKITKII